MCTPGCLCPDLCPGPGHGPPASGPGACSSLHRPPVPLVSTSAPAQLSTPVSFSRLPPVARPSVEAPATAVRVVLRPRQDSDQPSTARWEGAPHADGVTGGMVHRRGRRRDWMQRTEKQPEGTGQRAVGSARLASASLLSCALSSTLRLGLAERTDPGRVVHSRLRPDCLCHTHKSCRSGGHTFDLTCS